MKHEGVNNYPPVLIEFHPWQFHMQSLKALNIQILHSVDYI